MKISNYLLSLLFIFILGNMVGVIVGVTYQKEYATPPCPEYCTGYTKLAYGTAVNCYGDTIPILEMNAFLREYKRLKNKSYSYDGN